MENKLIRKVIRAALNWGKAQDMGRRIAEKIMAKIYAQPARAVDLGEHAHQGDPCIYCGVAHDDVAVGDCPSH